MNDRKFCLWGVSKFRSHSDDGTPMEEPGCGAMVAWGRKHGFKFCPYCGGEIERTKEAREARAQGGAK